MYSFSAFPKFEKKKIYNLFHKKEFVVIFKWNDYWLFLLIVPFFFFQCNLKNESQISTLLARMDLGGNNS